MAMKTALQKAGLMAQMMCLVGWMADYYLVLMGVKKGWVHWMDYYSAGWMDAETCLAG